MNIQLKQKNTRRQKTSWCLKVYHSGTMIDFQVKYILVSYEETRKTYALTGTTLTATSIDTWYPTLISTVVSETVLIGSGRTI